MDETQNPERISRSSAAGIWLGAGRKACETKPACTIPSHSTRKDVRPAAPSARDFPMRTSARSSLAVEARIEQSLERVFLVERAQLHLVGLHEPCRLDDGIRVGHELACRRGQGRADRS